MSDQQTQFEQRKRGIASIFSRTATTYDAVGPRFFSYFGRRLVEQAQIAKNAHVLDVATGRGAILFPAAEQVGPEGHIVGIDIAEGMIERVASEITERGIINAEAQVMDAEHLDFPDASFDYVLGGFAVFFFPQPEQTLAGFHRVLKPGGKLVLSTWGANDLRWLWLDDIKQKYTPAESQWPRPATSQSSTPVFNTSEGMQAFVSANKFSDVQVIAEDVEFFYADEEEALAVQSATNMRYLLDTLPSTLYDNWKSDMLDKLQKMKEDKGIPHRFFVLFTLATKA